MQLYAVNSELDSFWHNQNQKLLANQGFLNEWGDIFSDTFYFQHPTKRAKTKIDFAVFEKPHLKMERAATLALNGNSYPLSMGEYAKLAVINTITPKNTRSAIVVYRMMVHIVGFLNSQESTLLTLSNIEDFHLSYLTQSITEKGFLNRLSPESYMGSYALFDFIKSRNVLQTLGVEGVFDKPLMKKYLYSTLDNACQSVMGIKLAEYKKGGSFNFLGLELGQYYVDHLRGVYEADYLYSFVCQEAINSVIQQFDLDKSEYCIGKSRRLTVLLDTIQGTFVPNKVDREKYYITRDKLNSAMEQALFDKYKQHVEKVQSLREQNIHQVVEVLGLAMSFDAVEVIRVLMLQKYYSFTVQKKPEAVWQGYLNSLDKTRLDSHKLKGKTVIDVYTLMAKTVLKHRLDKTSFMSEIRKWSVAIMGGKQGNKITDLTGEFERVSAAMTNLVVAWLGYRASEFGFPLSAIHVEPNLDILDNSHVPFRFKLKWVVPKTNKETKIDREITSQCYQIAAQLNELFQPPEGSPCLYRGEGRYKGKPASNESVSYIDSRVKSNWESFVTQYQPFVEIIELQRLSQVDEATLSPGEKYRLQKLRAVYNLSSARAQNLLATCREVRRDIARLNSTAFGGKSQGQFKKSLIEFNKTGDISNPAHKVIVDEYLSDGTRYWLLSDDFNLDKKGMADISRELLQYVRYPTSHAFRHIWAEAILTRYQGNVGAVIRHQFCHLDESFFMAYLRDKEPQHLVKAARMKVLNSIVDSLIIDSKQIGSEYIGGFARFVKKAAISTKTITQSEIRELRERIAGRVISIQPSYFATCLPREGAESRAKCATFGDINPQNAKPEFCLNCTNALITEGNLKGIWLVIQPFVKESLSEDVMGFMVEQHLPLLHSGGKRIKDLQTEKNTESVSKILHVINKAIQNIKSKLKEEDGLYV